MKSFDKPRYTNRFRISPKTTNKRINRQILLSLGTTESPEEKVLFPISGIFSWKILNLNDINLAQPKTKISYSIGSACIYIEA